MEKFELMYNACKTFLAEKLSHVSSEALNWLATIVIHASTLPTFIAVGMGLTDKLPGVDVILMVWGGLTLLFFRAVLIKDMLNVATIGFGFILQATMLALIFFK
jgi:hypothetical protein